MIGLNSGYALLFEIEIINFLKSNKYEYMSVKNNVLKS